MLESGSAVRRRTRFRRASFLYGLAILILGLAAGARPNNMLVWAFACTLAAVLVSGLVSGAMTMPLRATRLEPRRGRVGEPLLIRYEIRNRSRIVPAFDLHVREKPVGGVPAAARLEAARLEAAGDAWVLHAGPRDRVHAEAVFRPVRRGIARLGNFEISTAFPFGILEKAVVFAQPAEILIHPELRPVREGVLSRVTSGGFGGHRLSSESGGSDDFFGVREYRPGDSIRSIAWKRLAGTGRLATIERSRAVPPRIRVLLDLRAPTSALRVAEGEDARQLEETAIVLAASLLGEAERLGYEYALSVAGFAAPPVALRRGHFHLEKLLSVLAAIELDAPRVAGAGLATSDERSTLIAVHPDRTDLSLAPETSWHYVARQAETVLAPRGGAA